MKNNQDSPNHPFPLVRNRAILLGRDLLEMNDWIILSCKESALPHSEVTAGDAPELVSISVVGPGDRALLDVLVRPDGAINSELLKLHGCDSAHTFNAPPFAGIYKILNAGFARTRVISWSPSHVQSILGKLCEQANLPQLKPVFLDFQKEFSGFVGHTDADGQTIKLQVLPPSVDSSQPGVTPMVECRLILSLIHEMAGTSQSSESAAFNKNWSAAFYKPKLGPTQKLKELLGLDQN